MNVIRKIFYRTKAKNRPFKLTRAGWVFILYTIGVGAGAINTGNNLLYLIFGVFLGLILASGVLSDLTLWRIDVVLNFPKFAQAGQSNLIGVSLTNRKKWFPSVSLTIEVMGVLRGKEIVLKKYIPAAFAKETIETHLVFSPSSRGLYEGQYLRLKTQFPFGLLVKWWRFPIQIAGRPEGEGNELIVHPETLENSQGLLSASETGDEQNNQSDQKGGGALIFGIREYQESDNPRRIHWKASAKRNFSGVNNSSNWLVKEMEADEKKSALFYWPGLIELKRLDGEAFEYFVRFAASLMKQMEDEDREVKLVFKSKDGNLKLITNHSLFLALVEQTEEAPKPLKKWIEDYRDRSGRIGLRIRLFDNFLQWKKRAA